MIWLYYNIGKNERKRFAINSKSFRTAANLTFHSYKRQNISLMAFLIM